MNTNQREIRSEFIRDDSYEFMDANLCSSVAKTFARSRRRKVASFLMSHEMEILHHTDRRCVSHRQIANLMKSSLGISFRPCNGDAAPHCHLRFYRTGWLPINSAVSR